MPEFEPFEMTIGEVADELALKIAAGPLGKVSDESNAVCVLARNRVCRFGWKLVDRRKATAGFSVACIRSAWRRAGRGQETPERKSIPGTSRREALPLALSGIFDQGYRADTICPRYSRGWR